MTNAGVRRPGYKARNDHEHSSMPFLPDLGTGAEHLQWQYWYNSDANNSTVYQESSQTAQSLEWVRVSIENRNYKTTSVYEHCTGLLAKHPAGNIFQLKAQGKHLHQQEYVQAVSKTTTGISTTTPWLREHTLD